MQEENISLFFFYKRTLIRILGFYAILNIKQQCQCYFACINDTENFPNPLSVHKYRDI